MENLDESIYYQERKRNRTRAEIDSYLDNIVAKIEDHFSRIPSTREDNARKLFEIYNSITISPPDSPLVSKNIP